MGLSADVDSTLDSGNGSFNAHDVRWSGAGGIAGDDPVVSRPGGTTGNNIGFPLAFEISGTHGDPHGSFGVISGELMQKVGFWISFLECAIGDGLSTID